KCQLDTACKLTGCNLWHPKRNVIRAGA
uniref:SVMP n=1 Tax=Panagrellus redivivus TaxID=6233 RepID=A0A7E4ZYN0_PANRE